MEATKQRKLPSQFTLDASPSYDIDTANGNDALSYEWSFSNNDNVSIDQSLDANKRIAVSFKEKGDYKVTLTVKDNYGNMTQLTKDISVQSALRPIIKLQPISAKLTTPMIFVAQTNRPVENYTWDFGDGTSRTIQTDHLTHTYSKIGNYTVKLTVTNADGESNDVSTNAFVGEANSPIP
ncbi:MAG: PKD domain-containing protein [bacterium]